MFRRAAPIFPVRDLEAALDFYGRLGFEVRRYAGGGYGYASRDGVELHLGHVPDSKRTTASAYVHVDDAEAIAAERDGRGSNRG